MKAAYLTACLMLGANAASAASERANVLDTARLHIEFGNAGDGPAADANRFDVINWQNSAGATVSNYIATGGPSVCDGEIYEFFGEARGGDTTEEPRFIVAGTSAAWSVVKPDLIGKTRTKSMACAGTPLAGTVAST